MVRGWLTGLGNITERGHQRAEFDLSLAGVIDFEEFVKESPKALRVNLVKLAKSNGHDLGFLA